MEGNYDETSIVKILESLSAKGETKDELAGATFVMRSKATIVKAPVGTIDTCGTGGDGQNYFDLDTSSGFPQIKVNAVPASGCTTTQVLCTADSTANVPCDRSICPTLNYEKQVSYTLMVTVTDGGNLFVEKQHIVRILDKNEAPSMDAAVRSIKENAPKKLDFDVSTAGGV